MAPKFPEEPEGPGGGLAGNLQHRDGLFLFQRGGQLGF
jgi:hypothetical protein